MRHLQIIGITLLAVIFFVGTVSAQKKPVKKPPLKKPVPIKELIPPLDVRAAREKVDVQRGNVEHFIDVLGPIAQGIEDIDASARTRPLPKATAEQNEENKRKVIEAIRNLKQGITDLESEFRTKPDLQKYFSTIEGIAELAAQAEDSAIAGKFVAAKEPLREVSKKLTDTLAALPK